MNDGEGSGSHEEPRLAELVGERVSALKALSYSGLKGWPAESDTAITIDGRSGAISVFVVDDIGEELLIVVHGFVERAVPRPFSPTIVALEGFRKHRDGSVFAASQWDLDEYD